MRSHSSRVENALSIRPVSRDDDASRPSGKYVRMSITRQALSLSPGTHTGTLVLVHMCTLPCTPYWHTDICVVPAPYWLLLLFSLISSQCHFKCFASDCDLAFLHGFYSDVLWFSKTGVCHGDTDPPWEDRYLSLHPGDIPVSEEMVPQLDSDCN